MFLYNCIKPPICARYIVNISQSLVCSALHWLCQMGKYSFCVQRRKVVLRDRKITPEILEKI